MKRTVLFLLFLALLCACSQQNLLQTGDLIFVGLPADAEAGSMDEAISLATGEIVHVAIVEVQADTIWIIDATTSRGVDRRPLEAFLQDFTRPDGAFPDIIVKRAMGIDADAAVQRAKTFCGRQYDTRFLPDNEEIYCSELVQKSYLYADGRPMFECEPMNFKAPDGSMPPYWEQSFAQLGMEVPQGLPGTNPQKMSRDSCLVEVCRLSF